VRILGLDISTKTGYAVFDDKKLVAQSVFMAGPASKYIGPDLESYKFIYIARSIASVIKNIIEKYNPNFIYIEQTNNGRNRTTQKLLEFIHFATLAGLEDTVYGSKIRYIDTSAWRKTLGIKLSKEDRINNKAVKKKERRGKITSKHLSVRWVNSTFNLNLKLKDNDIADAICIAYSGNCLESKYLSTNDINVESALDLGK
jgi:Holliday junction resolvasome RuvABC endonuclease subunit